MKIQRAVGMEFLGTAILGFAIVEAAGYGDNVDAVDPMKRSSEI